MATCTLGFDGGPKIAFRLDPNSVDWTWQIDTAVKYTVAGRVVQVLGATLSDVTITGSFGQDRTLSGDNGDGWRQAENFQKTITDIMEYQSRDADDVGKMQVPAVWNYPDKGWRFAVYVKELADTSGGGMVTQIQGRVAYEYQLTLFIVQDMSDTLVKAGETNGVLNQKKADAVKEYFARISDGIGWHFSEYNGPAASATTDAKDKNTKPQPAKPTLPVPPAQNPNVPGTPNWTVS